MYEIEFPLAALDLESVEAALTEIGASSITLVDRGDEPVLEPLPGEVRLWSDTLVRALFHENTVTESNDAAEQPSAESRAAPLEAAHHLARLAAKFGPHITRSARVTRVVEREWERVWLAGWKSMRFGRRLWVCPSAAEPPDDPNAIILRLDPGLAFGTGSHPTTALCLQILDSLPLAGRTVIDYGCGSGILGLAALKLGAARVTAVDIDPQALLATRDNAIRNSLSENIDVQGVDAPLVPAQCVVANILAGPLIDLAPTLTRACEPAGHLLLSGLLKTQAYAVKAAYASGFDKVQVVERDDWCCIFARRDA